LKLANEDKVNAKNFNNEIIEMHEMADNKKMYLVTDWRDMCNLNLGNNPAYSFVNAAWPINVILKGLNNQGLMLC